MPPASKSRYARLRRAKSETGNQHAGGVGTSYPRHRDFEVHAVRLGAEVSAPIKTQAVGDGYELAYAAPFPGEERAHPARIEGGVDVEGGAERMIAEHLPAA